MRVTYVDIVSGRRKREEWNATEVQRTIIAMKDTIKGIEILILEHILADLQRVQLTALSSMMTGLRSWA